MASIRRRSTAQGITHQVRWREGGQRAGKWCSATFPTAALARVFAAKVEAAGEQWPDDQPAAETMPLAEWAREYVASLTGITERTRADYRRDLERHVLPHFPGQVGEPDRAAVRAWVNDLAAKLAPKTIANLHGLLAAVFGEAVHAGLRADNPCDRTRLPRRDRAGDDMCFLTPQEFELVRGCAGEDGRDVLTVLVGTGLRWSELTALHVAAVDLLARTPRLSVVQAWKRQPDSTMRLGPPKTRRSRRTLTVSEAVVDALLPHLAGKAGDELVFTASKGGMLHHGNFNYRIWRPAVEKARKAGLEKKPRIHDLRHSHASWLIAAGVPLPAIQRRLGHESITTTVDRYGHLADGDDLGVSDAMDLALGRSQPAQTSQPGDRELVDE